MEDYIFGIRCNGVSIQVSQISIDEDQSMFDYICNVSLKDSWNGNGTYDVSIVNKDYVHGMPVGKWRIKKAWINYNWGESNAKLIMEDPDGSETCELVADSQRGSSSGFHIPSLVRAIFTKAQNIVRDYPNAKVCNAVAELKASKENLNIHYLKKYLNSENNGDEKFISNIKYVLDKLAHHLTVYTTTRDLLSKEEDQRSKLLLKDITAECRHLLLDLKNEIVNNN